MLLAEIEYMQKRISSYSSDRQTLGAVVTWTNSELFIIAIDIPPVLFI